MAERHGIARVLAAAGAFALGAVGCATGPPPTAEMAAAAASIAAADTVGAQRYAPHELELANGKLANAQKALAGKDHEASLRSAQQAQVDAQLAAAKSQAGHARQAADEALAAARARREDTERNARRRSPGAMP